MLYNKYTVKPIGVNLIPVALQKKCYNNNINIIYYYLRNCCIQQ